MWELPDSNRVPVNRVLLRAEFDSLRQAAADSAAAAAAAAADSLRAGLADSLGVTLDSAGAPIDSVAPVPPDTVVADTTALGAVSADSLTAAAQADRARTALLLAQRPTLFLGIVITTAEPLKPETRYWVEATVSNLLGAMLQSGRFLTVPAVAEPDST